MLNRRATPLIQDASITLNALVYEPGVPTVGQGRQVFAISLTLPATKENRKFSRRTLPYFPVQFDNFNAS
jgi:hypothetical protein